MVVVCCGGGNFPIVIPIQFRWHCSTQPWIVAIIYWIALHSKGTYVVVWWWCGVVVVQVRWYCSTQPLIVAIMYWIALHSKGTYVVVWRWCGGVVVVWCGGVNFPIVIPIQVRWHCYTQPWVVAIMHWIALHSKGTYVVVWWWCGVVVVIFYSIPIQVR